MKKLLILFGAIVLVFSACSKDEPMADLGKSELDLQLEDLLFEKSEGRGLAFFRLPEEGELAAIPQDPKNLLTTEKVELGRLLYHETALGLAPMEEIGRNTYSCASCHFAEAGFQAGRFQGIGEGGEHFGGQRLPDADYDMENVDVQAIRSPSTLNTAYQKNMLWNGQFGATGLNRGTKAAWTADTPKETNFLGYEGLETQAIAGLGVHRQDVQMDTLAQYGYKVYFDLAFPDFPESKRYTKETAGLAIAAYERTLLANSAPFQQWLRGYHQAMTDQQKQGAVLFFGKAGCGDCHTGPALNNMAFYGYGMGDLFTCGEEVLKSDAQSVENLGRGGFTGNPEDMYKFKTPQLYNLKDSPFYGHGSTFKSIREVVEYKNAGRPQNDVVPPSQLAEEFQPLGLSPDEIEAVTAFIEDALYDDFLQRYVPVRVLSGFCFPFNDPYSQIEAGCN
jgi:cytochrome c peroxidase